MKDIQVIGGDIAYKELNALPSTYDRVEAIFYHCHQTKHYCSFHEFQKARWHCRGALTEFRSIFDVLNKDLKDLRLNKIWDKSNFHQNIENSTLITILKKVRNLAVHTACVQGQVREYSFTLLDEVGEHDVALQMVFIDTIYWEHLSRDKDFHLSDKEVAWFNRQTEIWPAHLIIKEAVFATSVELINFLTTRKGESFNEPQRHDIKSSEL